MYNNHRGWGFITPDDTTVLPEDVQGHLNAGAEAAKAQGKEPEFLLYFRKPDIEQGYTPAAGAAVTFYVYTDDKGAGATGVIGV